MMTRAQFLKFLSFGTLAMSSDAMTRTMNPHKGTTPEGERMPVLFVGHGNPMNAISDNDFTRSWEAIAGAIPRPTAILCISAHWETDGTFVTAMHAPRTIHDFYGFPRALYEVNYPAPGTPDMAAEVHRTVRAAEVGLDQSWGLDHGTWSILVKMYPKADIPVFQLSLDRRKAPRHHYELARELSLLRRKGVLVMGSGNIVHNLRLADLSETLPPYDWAMEFDETVKRLLLNGNDAALVAYEKLGPSARLSIPTPEHYLPLLYAIGLRDDSDRVTFPTEGLAFRSGSMRSVLLGA